MVIINMKKTIAAAQFKAKCLQLMDDVKNQHTTLIITKHGVPIAKLAPIDEEPSSLYGALKGSITTEGDIIAPVGDTWDAT